MWKRSHVFENSSNRQYNLFSLTGRCRFLVGLVATTVLIAACQPQPTQIFIEVNGGRQALTTEATTVREALQEAKIDLGPLDRVRPDLYAELEPGLVIVVTQVEEKIITEREVIPFEHQIVTNDALSDGETRLAQLGANGEDEISIRVVYEDGIEVSRTEISRVSVIEAVPEILVVGSQGELPPVSFEGTIAYLSNGNAWLLRDSSGSRRALTTEGNLDGRAFSLSPDGRQLFYTTKLTDEIELPLNEAWLASTTIVGEAPITTGLQGVLQAVWSPVVTQSLIAYTTAERTASAPGWRANNDLWLLDLVSPAPKPVQVLPANTQGLYPWWGTTFTWSPDGTQLAYARADQIGTIDLSATRPLSDDLFSLVDFTPLETFSEWVWVPDISWSPDGRFIAATIHGPPLAAEPAEESQVFDLWLLSVDGTVSAKVAEKVGMWARPTWGEAGIAYGQAIEPLQSVNSRYSIQLIDQDGSNRRQLFPFQDEAGVQLPELIWSPTGNDLLFAYNGNLYTTNSLGSPAKQLTVDSQAGHLQWVVTAPIIAQATITDTINITDSGSITGNGIITDNDLAGHGAGIDSEVLSEREAGLTVTITPEPATLPTPEASQAIPKDKATIQPAGPVTGSATPDTSINQQGTKKP
jgi:WD40 repeat protein